MADICFVCLKYENSLVDVIGYEKNTDEVLYKFKDCIPEIEWNFNFKICNSCKEDLSNAYNFKKLCITSYTSWKNLTPYISSKENVSKKDEVDSDHDVTLPDLISEVEEDPFIDTNFTCIKCKESFKSKMLLENHLKFEHETKKRTPRGKNVPCKLCGKMYATQNAVQKHFKSCSKKNKGLCQIKKGDNNTQINCDKNISKDKKEIEKGNRLSEDIDITIPPTCSLCGTTFCNKYLLKRHLQNVHATEKKFKCDMCDRTFASPVYLNAHKRYHAGDRSHICSFCGKGFITASDLYHHEKIHANKRSYRCEICPKAFNTSSDLHKHKICVHLDRSKWKYICTYCQRRFPLKTNLDTHIKTHTGEKNYPCHLCDRRCINKSVLMRHIETHSNVIAFKCNLCMQGYKYRKSLDVHMAKIHGIGNVKIPERTKKFFCHLCPKSYFANNKLQKHIRSHNGERPFQCTNCSKSFVDKSYIKQHLKTAHNIVVDKFEY